MASWFRSAECCPSRFAPTPGAILVVISAALAGDGDDAGHFRHRPGPGLLGEQGVGDGPAFGSFLAQFGSVELIGLCRIWKPVLGFIYLFILIGGNLMDYFDPKDMTPIGKSNTKAGHCCASNQSRSIE